MKTDLTITSEDEMLILLYKQGNQDAFSRLMKIYTPMIQHYSKMYYAKGLLTVDLFQEGCIGLYIALTKFQACKASFRTFAEMHIKSKIINAVKGATRKKHQILNQCISFFIVKEIDSRGEILLLDMLVSDIPTPEELYLKKEDIEEKKLELIQLMKTMAPIEQLVFKEIINGKSYREASENIGFNSKAIDNALRRIKKKVLKRISYREHRCDSFKLLETISV